MKEEAPGKPGSVPRWTSSQKDGIGTSLTDRSLVWFTLSHGILNEVYFPDVDSPNTRDMQFLVTDGKSFFSEEKKDTITQTYTLETGIPVYKIINTCKEKKYRITKTIFTNPFNNCLIQRTHFIALEGAIADYRLYVLLAPHIRGSGGGNNAWIGHYKGLDLLYASKDKIRLGLSCNIPFLKMSCGFVGTSDGWHDISQNYRMTNTYKNASNGNVALTAEIDLKRSDGHFTNLISFGLTAEETGKQAKGTYFGDHEVMLKEYMRPWREKLKSCKKLKKSEKKLDHLYKNSTMVLNTHLDKRTWGAVIASLSIPWGTSKGDKDIGGYHLIWPRDLVEIAGGFIAMGDIKNARKILFFLMTVQEEDGHFNQCMWHDGGAYWSNIQMDETALPILLADMLRRNKALNWFDVWPLVSKAAEYIATHGPVTPQDRWEEDGGYTPFTLSCEIAALLAAADFYDEKGLTLSANYLRDIADNWNSQIEKWTYIEDSEFTSALGVKGYYVRITPENIGQTQTKKESMVEVKNRPPDEAFSPSSKIISTDALALVRFGLRDAKDPKIINTVDAIDRILKKETRSGPVWKRYNEDGYGEHSDGRDFDGTGTGRGWPLLVGERGHYELAKGNLKGAEKMLHHLVRQSGPNYLLPEQIWDSEDIPKRWLINGGPTLGAMPLVWAHSEYIKLLRSVQEKKVFDMPPQTYKRYVKNKKKSHLTLWRYNHKCVKAEKSKTLRIELRRHATVKWSTNDKSPTETKTQDSGIGLYFIDIPTNHLKVGSSITFTFFWDDTQTWEDGSFTIKIIPKKEEKPCN